MRFYRLPNGYAKSIVQLNGYTEISEEEYNAAVPYAEPDSEPAIEDKAKAYDILMGEEEIE